MLIKKTMHRSVSKVVGDYNLRKGEVAKFIDEATYKRFSPPPTTIVSNELKSSSTFSSPSITSSSSTSTTPTSSGSFGGFPRVLLEMIEEYVPPLITRTEHLHRQFSNDPHKGITASIFIGHFCLWLETRNKTISQTGKDGIVSFEIFTEQKLFLRLPKLSLRSKLFDLLSSAQLKPLNEEGDTIGYFTRYSFPYDGNCQLWEGVSDENRDRLLQILSIFVDCPNRRYCSNCPNFTHVSVDLRTLYKKDNWGDLKISNGYEVNDDDCFDDDRQMPTKQAKILSTWCNFFPLHSLQLADASNSDVDNSNNNNATKTITTSHILVASDITNSVANLIINAKNRDDVAGVL